MGFFYDIYIGRDKYMNPYVTGNVIKELREKCQLTQVELAEKIGVSDKTVSKWETAKGYPDISLLEPIAGALGVSMTELVTGNAEARVKINGVKKILFYCNRDGLFSCTILKGIDDKQASYDDAEERKVLEEIAGKLFG